MGSSISSLAESFCYSGPVFLREAATYPWAYPWGRTWKLSHGVSGFWIHGRPGVGKSWVLQRLNYSDNADIVIFLDLRQGLDTSSLGNFILSLYDRFAVAGLTLPAVAEWPTQDASRDTVSLGDLDIFIAIMQALRSLANQTRIVLIFDHAEAILFTTFGRWFVDYFLSSLDNIVVVVAARYLPQRIPEGLIPVEVTGLTADEFVAMLSTLRPELEKVLGFEIGEYAVAKLYRLTGGNPRCLEFISSLAKTADELPAEPERIWEGLESMVQRLQDQEKEPHDLADSTSAYWADVIWQFQVQNLGGKMKRAVQVIDLVLVPAQESAEGEASTALTPEYLAGTVAPYLVALGEIQHVLDEVQGGVLTRVRIRSITQSSPISISLEGIADAVDALKGILVKWRREHATSMAKLDEQQAQVAIDKAKAEVQGIQADAEKTEAEAAKLQGEAAVQHATAEKIAVEVEQLRVQLYRDQMQLALDLISRLAPNAPEVDKAVYLQKLLPAVSTLALSELAMITDASRGGQEPVSYPWS